MDPEQTKPIAQEEVAAKLQARIDQLEAKVMHLAAVESENKQLQAKVHVLEAAGFAEAPGFANCTKEAAMLATHFEDQLWKMQKRMPGLNTFSEAEVWYDCVEQYPKGYMCEAVHHDTKFDLQTQRGMTIGRAMYAVNLRALEYLFLKVSHCILEHRKASRLLKCKLDDFAEFLEAVRDLELCFDPARRKYLMEQAGILRVAGSEDPRPDQFAEMAKQWLEDEAGSQDPKDILTPEQKKKRRELVRNFAIQWGWCKEEDLHPSLAAPSCTMM